MIHYLCKKSNIKTIKRQCLFKNYLNLKNTNLKLNFKVALFSILIVISPFSDLLSRPLVLGKKISCDYRKLFNLFLYLFISIYLFVFIYTLSKTRHSSTLTVILVPQYPSPQTDLSGSLASHTLLWSLNPNPYILNIIY